MSDPHARTRFEQAEPEHEHVAELLRAVDMRAPERLHERVQGMVADRMRPAKRASRSRRAEALRHHTPDRGLIAARLKPTLAAMAIAAIAGGAIALLTGTGTRTAGPSVGEASALTLRAATMGAPSESTAHAAQLNVAVDGVAFPYWNERFGWRATGARRDTVGRRAVTTVFYADASGRRIGYAILAGTPAPRISGGVIAWRGAVPYRLLTENGASVVTWLRDGRLCVVSGHGVSSATLLRLASWSEHDATSS